MRPLCNTHPRYLYPPAAVDQDSWTYLLALKVWSTDTGGGGLVAGTPVEGDVEVDVLNQNVVCAQNAQGKFGVADGAYPDGGACGVKGLEDGAGEGRTENEGRGQGEVIGKLQYDAGGVGVGEALCHISNSKDWDGDAVGGARAIGGDGICKQE